MNKNTDMLYLLIYARAVFMFIRVNDLQHSQCPNTPNAHSHWIPWGIQTFFKNIKYMKTQLVISFNLLVIYNRVTGWLSVTGMNPHCWSSFTVS